MYIKGILKDRIYLQGNFQVEKQCGSVTIHISNTLYTQVNDILLIGKKIATEILRKSYACFGPHSH